MKPTATSKSFKLSDPVMWRRLQRYAELKGITVREAAILILEKGATTFAPAKTKALQTNVLA